MSLATLAALKAADCELNCITKDNQGCMVLSSIGLDLVTIITSIVLASLGLCGVIHLPIAACYALIGVGSAFLLADIGMVIAKCIKNDNSSSYEIDD